MNTICTWIGNLTNPPLLILYTLLAYGYTCNKILLPFVCYLIIVVLFAITLKKVMYTCCKHLKIIQRPKNTHIGMPSAHAMTSIFVATYLSRLYPKYILEMYIAAGLVIFSRVYTREHSPLQVTVGALIGYILGTLA